MKGDKWPAITAARDYPDSCRVVSVAQGDVPVSHGKVFFLPARLVAQEVFVVDAGVAGGGDGVAFAAYFAVQSGMDMAVATACFGVNGAFFVDAYGDATVEVDVAVVLVVVVEFFFFGHVGSFWGFTYTLSAQVYVSGYSGFSRQNCLMAAATAAGWSMCRWWPPSSLATRMSWVRR